ncbi:hypothetical protein CR513_31897, partial [Mucuna pruriens]
MPNYYWWTNHGEELPQFPPMVVEGSYYGSGEQREEFNPYEQLIMDHAGPSIGEHIENMEENPNPEAQKFFDLLVVAQAPLWERCDNHSELSISLAVLSLKFDYNMLEGCFNLMVQLMDETMPKGPSNPKHKIDVYLQPLIDELCTLWNDGILTYDVLLRQNFMMKAALMWTVNDLQEEEQEIPGYGVQHNWKNK